ncbi:MAG: hypothetical protein M3O46_01485 [Myxococcota bacterium]|nr:hypothetical protein [Myxococcota bacterium]
MRDWPDPYIGPTSNAEKDPSALLSPAAPAWRTTPTLVAGMILAETLLELLSPPAPPPTYLRDRYLLLVHEAKTHPNVDFTDEYRKLIEEATDAYVSKSGRTEVRRVPSALAAVPQKALFDYSAFNANDFANVHRVAWLLLGRALTSLTNLNPHGDWGDPPPNGSAHPQPGERAQALGDVEIMNYHYVPNLTGFYAVSGSDVGTPNAGT